MNKQIINEQTNNKLYTSKEYVNAKQIMLSRCVVIKIAVVSPGSVVGNVHFISDLHPKVVIRMVFYFLIFTLLTANYRLLGEKVSLVAATNVTCAVQVCIFCIFFWKIDGKKISL